MLFRSAHPIGEYQLSSLDSKTSSSSKAVARLRSSKPGYTENQALKALTIFSKVRFGRDYFPLGMRGALLIDFVELGEKARSLTF